MNEVRYVLRTLRQNPGFALTALLSIALAIGANSTIFSYANGMLLRPLPVPDHSRVVTVRSLAPAVGSGPLRGTGESRMSYPDFQDFTRNNHSFDGLVAFSEVVGSLAQRPDATPQFRLGYQVSGDFFRVLKVEPQLGRGFRLDEDEKPGEDSVVVLSHDLWKNEFASAQSVIGSHVVLNNVSFTVIGVAPALFTGMDQVLQPDFFIPIGMASRLFASLDEEQTDRNRREFVVKGRLKAGVSIRTAAAEAAALARSLEEMYPATNRGARATVVTEIEMRLINWPVLGRLVGALFTIAVVVLVIACANVANLMLSRGRARAREIAVRLAVGASRAKLIRLLLIESLIIAFAGGVLAVIAARFTAGFLSAIEVPSDVPIHLDAHMDDSVLWFTAAVSAASVLLFGLLPAIYSTRSDLVSVIKAGESEETRKRLFGRHALVAVQIAGTMILLVLTVQGRRNFNDLLAGNPGFATDHRITMRFDPEVSGYGPEQTQRFYDTVAARVPQVSGVVSSALTSSLPMTFDPIRLPVIPEGYQFPPDRSSAQTLTTIVDSGYFRTLAVPILAGRGFLSSDRIDTPRVAVVNDAFAKQYFGGQAVGKRLKLNEPDSPWIEVVGVTVTGVTFSLIEPKVKVVYLPLSQNFRSRMTLVAHTLGDPAALAAPLQETIRSIDPNIRIFRVRSMQDVFDYSSASTIGVVARIYDGAAVLGLLLALVGLYAVVSYHVTRRTREIGIRMALGAGRRQVARIFVGLAVKLSLTGILSGLLLSVFANSLSESLIGPSRPGPLLLASVSVALLATTLAASMIPARRAARIDPQQALRQG